MTDRFWSLFVRAAGAALVLSFLAPAYRLLVDSQGNAVPTFLAAGPALFGQGVVALAGVAVAGLMLGPVAGTAIRRIPASRVKWVDDHLAPLSGMVAACASVAFSLFVLEGAPFLVDGMSQLLQANLLVGGALEMPAHAPIEFWYFQYLAPSTGGWASQYPIGYPALLAMGLWVGAPWLLGPVCHGVTAFLGVHWVRRLVPDDPAVARSTALLLALSPFALALSGAYMNHGVAALLGLGAMMAAERSHEGPGSSGLVAGLCVGGIATMRPLTGVLVAAAAAVMWLARTPDGERARLRFPLASCAGALPPIVALLWLNRRLFGAPLTFGYTAAQGPNHGLGFHVDPWGAAYGLREAFGYAGTELRALGAEMLGLPLPALLVLGVVLLIVRVPARRMGPILAWALLPAVAGLFYWHHDLAMGPRLLSDSAPAWSILLGWSLVLGARAVAERGPRMRGVVQATTVVVLLSGSVVTVLRLAAYSAPTIRMNGSLDVPGSDALVFVHDSWESRLSARLAALGARDDQIRALRSSRSTCDLQRALDDLGGAGALDPRLLDRWLAEPVNPALVRRVMPSGSPILTQPGEELSGACQREAASDFNGVAGLPQRVWRGDVPGHERGRTMYVRDLGPERNREVLSAWPDRRAYVLVPAEPARLPDLLPYDEGMARLWSAVGGSAGG